MATVYIETSIPSMYHETRSDPRIVAWKEATREWWDRHRGGFDLCASAFTLIELEAAPSVKSKAALKLMGDVRVLEEVSGMADVIDYYVEHQLMPAGGDAVHLAFASMHGIDFLLTWNCRHLANANKTRHLQVLNGRLGLAVPIITTPWTLFPEQYFDERAQST